MIHVTTNDLRNLIYFKTNETINEYRTSKEIYEKFPMATEDEVDEFIRTIPYYDEELKKILLDEHCNSAFFVSTEWFGRFYLAVTDWFDSEEWLEYSPLMLAKSLINYKNESISKLSIPQTMT